MRSRQEVRDHWSSLRSEIETQWERAQQLRESSLAIRRNYRPVQNTLSRLLEISQHELGPALSEAADILTEVFECEGVDFFLHDPTTGCLVAIGSSDTPIAQRRRQLGLDRLHVKEPSRIVEVFRSGLSRLDGDVDEDLYEHSGIAAQLGVRSSMICRIESFGSYPGVVRAICTRINAFNVRDLRVLEAVARWAGLFLQATAATDERASLDANDSTVLTPVFSNPLTRRQQELALLVAQGLSNAEIADALTLTPGTVANHVAGILKRLNVRNRAQVAIWATKHLSSVR